MVEANKPQGQQLIQIIAAQLGWDEEGSAALILTLEGGAELPLQFQYEDLVKLRAQIDEAVKLADRRGSV